MNKVSSAVKKSTAATILRAAVLASVLGVFVGIPAVANDVNPYTFRFATGQVYGDMSVAALSDRDVYIGEDAAIQLSVEGGNGSPIWSSIGTALPSGLTLSGSTGRISGFPTISGVYGGLQFRATDGSGNVIDTDTFAVTVLEPVAAQITPTDMLVGHDYSFPILANGGRGPYAFSVNDGALPGGISISGQSVAGTPSARGVFAADIRISDTNGRYATVAFDSVVREELVAAWSLPDAYVGEHYSGLLSATGGEPPFYWELLTGSSLPDGLGLDENTGVVSGNPGSEVLNHAFDAVVVDDGIQHASVGANISVYSLPRITQSTIGTLIPGVEVSFNLASEGGKPAISWSAGAGMPTGLALSADGTLSGSPTVVGTYTPEFTIRDANNRISTENVTIHVFEVLSANLPSRVETYVGDTHSFELSPTGGKQPLAWAGSGFPAGLALTPDGTVQGVPTTAGSRSASVEVTDALGASSNGTLAYDVFAPIAITDLSHDPLYVGIPVSGSSFSATGGKNPLSWSLASGTLPQGISVNPAGRFTGTPQTAGTADNVVIRATDPNGRNATSSLSLEVLAQPVIAAASLPEAYIGQTYSAPVLAASGGRSPLSWAATGLPAGMSINTSSGAVGGTPSGSNAADNPYTAQVSVTDANGVSASRNFTIMVRGALNIVNASPGNRVATIAGASYQFTATGGRSGYAWSRSGSFPAGLSLSSSGLLSGTASTAGTYNFEVVVTDANDVVASRSVTMTVTPPASCTTPWGATVGHGQSITAYSTSSPTCGASCVSEQRTCNNGSLSGSYGSATCNALAQCSYAWQVGGFGACSANPTWTGFGGWGACSASCGGGVQYAYRSCTGTSGTQTRAVSCRRSDGTIVSDSYCGSKPATSQACSASCSGSSSTSQSCNTHSCGGTWVKTAEVCWGGTNPYSDPACPAGPGAWCGSIGAVCAANPGTICSTRARTYYQMQCR